MDVKLRVMTCRLIEKINANSEYSKLIGVEYRDTKNNKKNKNKKK